jgi:hypothetical protein
VIEGVRSVASKSHGKRKAVPHVAQASHQLFLTNGIEWVAIFSKST